MQGNNSLLAFPDGIGSGIPSAKTEYATVAVQRETACERRAFLQPSRAQIRKSDL
jgi:hypothetical protein